MQPAYFEVCVTSGDSPWQPAPRHLDGRRRLDLFTTDWSPGVLFRLVPARDAKNEALPNRQRPDEFDPLSGGANTEPLDLSRSCGT
jgi:hypothetical protein